MQNLLDLFYKLDQHHLLIADHLIFDWIKLNTLLIYEPLNKHHHFLAHKHDHWQLISPLTAPSELYVQWHVAHMLVAKHLMHCKHR